MGCANWSSTPIPRLSESLDRPRLGCEIRHTGATPVRHAPRASATSVVAGAARPRPRTQSRIHARSGDAQAGAARQRLWPPEFEGATRDQRAYSSAGGLCSLSLNAPAVLPKIIGRQRNSTLRPLCGVQSPAEIPTAPSNQWQTVRLPSGNPTAIRRGSQKSRVLRGDKPRAIARVARGAVDFAQASSASLDGLGGFGAGSCSDAIGPLARVRKRLSFWSTRIGGSRDGQS